MHVRSTTTDLNHVTTPRRPHYEHSESTNYTLNTTKAAQKMISATEQDLVSCRFFRMKFTMSRPFASMVKAVLYIFILNICLVCPICANRFNVYRHFNMKHCSWQGVLDTTLCDKICQCLATGRWFSLCTPVSSV
jgi:hypothetical protein